MNAQRWLALGVLVAIAACLATMNIWLFPLLEREDEPTPTPDADAVAAGDDEDADAAGDGDGDSGETPTPEPTLDPAVAAIMADLEMEEMAIGLDPFITRAGDFAAADPTHRVEGHAAIYQLSEQQRVLRLEPFSITDGPDLRVILSPHEAPRTSAETLLPTYLDLGELRSPDGAQNYEIPEGQLLGAYESVVIYSMSLNIVYASAPLTEVRGR